MVYLIVRQKPKHIDTTNPDNVDGEKATGEVWKHSPVTVVRCIAAAAHRAADLEKEEKRRKKEEKEAEKAEKKVDGNESTATVTEVPKISDASATSVDTMQSSQNSSASPRATSLEHGGRSVKFEYPKVQSTPQNPQLSPVAPRTPLHHGSVTSLGHSSGSFRHGAGGGGAARARMMSRHHSHSATTPLLTNDGINGRCMTEVQLSKYVNFVATQKMRIFDAAVDELVDSIKSTVPMEVKQSIKDSNPNFITAGLIFVAHNQVQSSSGATGGGTSSGNEQSADTMRFLRRRISEARELTSESANANASITSTDSTQASHSGGLTSFAKPPAGLYTRHHHANDGTTPGSNTDLLENLSVDLDELALQNTLSQGSKLGGSTTESNGGSSITPTNSGSHYPPVPSQQGFLSPPKPGNNNRHGGGGGGSAVHPQPHTVLEALQFGMFEKIMKRLLKKEEKTRSIILEAEAQLFLEMLMDEVDRVRHVITAAEQKERQKLSGSFSGEYLLAATKAQEARRSKQLSRANQVSDQLCEEMARETDQFMKSEAKKHASSTQRLDSVFDDCEQVLVSQLKAECATKNASAAYALRQDYQNNQGKYFGELL